MKKFISLFVVAAVLAFAGMAFAGDANITLSAYSDYTGNAVNNNDGATSASDPDGWKSDAFYFGTVTAFEIGTKVAFSDNANGGDAYGAEIDSNVIFNETGKPATIATDTTATNVVFSVPFSANAIDMVIGSYAKSTPELKSTTTKTLRVTPREVTYTASDVTNGKYTLKTDGTDKTITIKANYNDGAAKTIEGAALSLVVKSGDKTSAKTLSGVESFIIGDGTNGVGAKYEDGVITLKSVGAVADGTKATLTVMGDTGGQEVTASKETIAGIDENTVIMSIEITTASYIVEPATVTYPVPASVDSYVSFDIDMAIADLDNISLDNYIVTSKDVNSAGTAAVSKDFVVSNDVPKAGHIAVTIGKDTLNAIAETLEAGEKKTVEWVVTDKSTPAKSVKLVVNFTNTLTPVEPFDQPTAAQKAAIEALVVGSEDLGLKNATSHDAISEFVDNEIPAEISNDVRAYFEITQPVENAGDYVAMDGSKLTLKNKKTGESVTFFKDFGDEKNPDRISLRDAMSGDVLQAAVLIVDGPVPAAVKDAWTGKDTKQGVVIRKVDGVNVVVIYDGSANNMVVDPIYALVNRGSSSSSCDLGFGLVAVAGLAALALRKRSK